MAALCFRLRHLLAFSEAAALKAGIPAQQHQALLSIAGHRGPELPTVGSLSEQLLVLPHTAAELVARMVEAGLVIKFCDRLDRRRKHLALTSKAERPLETLTTAHLEKLRGMEAALIDALVSATGRSSFSPPSSSVEAWALNLGR